MSLRRIVFFSALLSIVLSSVLLCRTKSNNTIEYISPLPGSEYNKKETNIIIRFKYPLDVRLITPENFRISGSNSGQHNFNVIFPDDKYTVILKPDIYFAPGERVTFGVYSGFDSDNRTKVFTYNISNHEISNHSTSGFAYFENMTQRKEYDNSGVSEVSPPFFRSDPIPSDFPKLKVTKLLGTAPGYIFVSNFPFGPLPNVPYLMVLNNIGKPVLYKKMNSPCFDFKVQNNNTFTYFEGRAEKFYATNASFSIIDSFYCGNGYSTDLHELLLLPNNHAYLMSYDSQRVDMSKIIEGGDTAAVVSGLIIQEIDQNKNVVFQWRSWDHFQITDASHHVDLKAHSIDYVHGNAIDLDFDGNVLISSRHLDEITKINRQTGNIIWRLGGKKNQFTFINDPIRFSLQHAIRKLANGNYILFDNGEHTPLFSRAVEYKLDEIRRTATLVWEYRNTLYTFSLAMGNAQRLPNGNTLIGWGSTNPTVTEVRPNGTKVFEMSLPNGVFSYRAFRQTWEGSPEEVIPSRYTLFQNYPNPFNPVTYIRYDLLEGSYVTLKIYDIVGKEITTLISENQQPGTYLVDFNGQNLSSGIYFYKLTTNNYEQSKKMVLVK